MPPFEQRALGRNGPQISALGLGCWGMSGTYGASDDAEALRTIDRALELGITLLDTADVYGEGHNEEFVGRALRGRRDGVLLATKFGRTFGTAGARGVNGRPEYVRAACDASLKRLCIEAIDLYYQHRVDPNVPIEETVGAMVELKNAGKIRYLGLSEAGSDNIRAPQRPCTRSRHCRASTPSSAATLKTTACCSAIREPRHHAGSVQPTRPRHASPRRCAPTTALERAIRARTTRASPATISARNVEVVDRFERAGGGAQTGRARNWRWRGSTLRAATSCRSRGPNG